ncbi:MAG: hypothetical protein AB8B63_22215 [Granulosicoccus sp.]
MKFLASLALAASMALTQPCAAQFQELLPVYLEPGDVLEHSVAWQREPGVRVEFRLLEAPEGAELEFGSEGAVSLNWRPGNSLPDETSILIVARDIDKDTVILRHRLQVRNAEEFPVENETPISREEPSIKIEVPRPTVTEPIVLKEPVPAKAMRGPRPDTTVSISAIASQIVSIGRKVTFHASASSADNSPPVLTIDRLPDNATFDSNADGSRTFFWQTSSGDEGEHRFRVFAHHPDDRGSIAVQDFTIIVGDPATRKTEPKSFRDSGS